MTGLYVHIPFCVRKCLYCDFPSYGGISSYLDDYVEALCREIRATSYIGEAADTVYFGGGTPSLLTARQGEKIMSALTDTFRIDADSEITFEVNPDGIKSDYIRDLIKIGVNRISMGIQSFDDRLLQLLRRVHTSAEAFAALEAVRTGGVTNVSADLIYGLPGQSPEDAENDARTLIGLGVTHASAYSLIVEEGTMLKRLVRKGEILLPEDRVTEEAGERVCHTLEKGGLKRYEISAYAAEGFQSKHNLKYWQYEPYIGFGASSHSFDGTYRFSNIRSLPEYIKNAGKTSVLAEHELIGKERGEEDFCFLGLRTMKGIDNKRFEQCFKRTVTDAFGTVIKDLVLRGFLEKTEWGYCLTSQGILYGNYVFSRFLR